MVYAELNEAGDLVPTREKVGFAEAPQGRKKNLKPRKETRCNTDFCKREKDEKAFKRECTGKSKEECELVVRRMLSTYGDGRRLAPTTGTLKNLVILMRFKDHETRVLPTRENYDILMNTAGVDSIYAPTSSVKTFWTKTSHGMLTIESTVVGWVTLPNTEAYYSGGQSGYVMINEYCSNCCLNRNT
jgi:hypothetical protein